MEKLVTADRPPAFVNPEQVAMDYWRRALGYKNTLRRVIDMINQGRTPKDIKDYILGTNFELRGECAEDKGSNLRKEGDS